MRSRLDKLCRFVIAVAVLGAVVASQAAPGRYVELETFLQSTLGSVPRDVETLYVDAALRRRIEDVLGHDFARLRLRFWRAAETTAWVLDEVGKTEPITFGIAIKKGRVTSVQVLEFRESRGWEIRYPFFTDQYAGTELNDNDGIDRAIDGITGATLSVNAANKVVRVALICDESLRLSK